MVSKILFCSKFPDIPEKSGEKSAIPKHYALLAIAKIAVNTKIDIFWRQQYYKNCNDMKIS